MTKENLTIEFSSREEMLAFCKWLCNRGESDYWDYCDHPRFPAPAVTFTYHTNGKFMAGNIIHTKPMVQKSKDECEDE